MKTLKTLAVAAVLCSSLPLISQQASGSASDSASASANGSQVNQSAAASAQASRHGASAQGSRSGNGSSAITGLGSANGSANGSGNGSAQMTPVNGELVGKLDSKTAKAGDPVVMKTTQKARTADGTEIPKGTRLIGHVTDVQAHGSGSQDSHLGLAFDRAELKNGQMMPIHSFIQSVSPTPMAANAASMGDDDLFASAPLSSGGAMGGGAIGGGAIGGGAAGSHSGGGGLVGGGRSVIGGAGSVTGGTVNAVGSGASSAGAGLGSTTHGTLNTAGGTAINAGHGTLNGAAAGSGSLASHATGIPGVMLGGDASGAASGMLSATNRNVHLDSGTQMVVGLSSAIEK